MRRRFKQGTAGLPTDIHPFRLATDGATGVADALGRYVELILSLLIPQLTVGKAKRCAMLVVVNVIGFLCAGSLPPDRTFCRMKGRVSLKFAVGSGDGDDDPHMVRFNESEAIGGIRFVAESWLPVASQIPSKSLGQPKDGIVLPAANSSDCRRGRCIKRRMTSPA